MAATNAMEEAIRAILAGGEDITHGWGDRQIVEEARRRVGNGSAPDGGAIDRWVAMIAELRSETDNDGQGRQ